MNEDDNHAGTIKRKSIKSQPSAAKVWVDYFHLGQCFRDRPRKWVGGDQEAKEGSSVAASDLLSRGKVGGCDDASEFFLEAGPAIRY